MAAAGSIMCSYAKSLRPGAQSACNVCLMARPIGEIHTGKQSTFRGSWLNNRRGQNLIMTRDVAAMRTMQSSVAGKKMPVHVPQSPQQRAIAAAATVVSARLHYVPVETLRTATIQSVARCDFHGSQNLVPPPTSTAYQTTLRRMPDANCYSDGRAAKRL